ncbi:MAG: tRNA preQ1(34) S-adenosylmethionine ribosyltransferase-isomerase QueA [Rhizobiaceae bacterium]|nr:tRNA preQ1(34) S-adenosylmethionine ribosyltransferase-isomerase QueA [Rhizobiaceae bacterium]
MKVDLFDFDLPEENIALRPANPRDSAKFLIVNDGLEDRIVSELPDLLKAGDVLVFNDTKVIPTQLTGVRIREGATASISATLHTRIASDRWLCFAKGSKKLKEGDRIRFGVGEAHCGTLDCTVRSKDDAGNVELLFDLSGAAFDQKLMQVGTMPLPPYIAGKRGADDQDKSDYQTMYAREEGAVAAPTAGLHFTPELMQALEQKGILLKYVTLHVGPGTFLPMKVDNTEDHEMHSEWGVVSHETADAINTSKANGGRLVCVGTTSLRLIESAAQDDGMLAAWEGDTDIFITPGYRFKAVDMLMTNFHLPKSTLFMLVSALCGLDAMKAAYQHAIENDYRFYSYGDSSLLYRKP